MPKQEFKIILKTSNTDVEDIKNKLQTKLSEWLDNVSFITGKREICKSVEIIKNGKTNNPD